MHDRSVTADQKQRAFSGCPFASCLIVYSTVFFSLLAAAPQTLAASYNIERVPVQTLALPESSLQQTFEITVRGVSEADSELLERLRADNRSLVSTGLGVSAAAVAEAFLIPGFYSGSLIASAVILVPLTVTVGVMEKRQHDAIEKALTESRLIDLVSRNLQSRVQSDETALDDSIAVEVVILAYGLTRKPVCLFASAAIKVRVQGQKVFEDLIYIEPFLRSADSPPPICRSIEDFAQNDGKLIKNGFIDYAQIISAIIVKRTKALPWKD